MKVIQKAIIKQGEKFLILKRSPKAESFPNYWDFPGGKLEIDEEPFSGIEREVLEETKLIIHAIRVVGEYDFDQSQQGAPTHRFVVFETKGEIKNPILSHEHTDFKWKTKNEILKMEIEPYMKEYFKKNN